MHVKECIYYDHFLFTPGQKKKLIYAYTYIILQHYHHYYYDYTHLKCIQLLRKMLINEWSTFTVRVNE